MPLLPGWRGKGSRMEATLILFDSESELHSAVRTRVAELATAEWVDESLWINATDVNEGESAGITVGWLKGDVVSSEGVVEARVLHYLGQKPLKMVRVVGLQLVTAMEPGSAAVAAALARLAEVLPASLSQDATLLTISLVIPTSDAGGMRDVVLAHGIGGNIVVPSEDRIGDEYADQHVLHPGNYVCHAALHVLTIAGLWRAMPHGPLDWLAAEHSKDGSPQPILVRGLVRTVVIRDVVRRVIEAALSEPREQWPVPAEGVMACPDPSVLVRDVLNQLGTLDGGTFRFKQGPRREPGTIEAPTPYGAIPLMLNYMWSTARRLPDRMQERVRQEIHRLTQQTAVWRNVDHVQDEQREEDMGRMQMWVQRMLEKMGRASRVTSHPEVWKAVRQVTFGLLDGGPLPSAVEEPVLGDRRLVLDGPGYVVPAPYEGDFVCAGAVKGCIQERGGPFIVGFCDAREARRLGDHLTQEIRERESAAGRIQVGEEAADGDEAAMRELLVEEKRRFDEWVEDRRRALLWQLAERLGHEYDGARNAFEHARRRLNTVPGDVDISAGDRAFARLKKWWLVVTIALLAGAGAAGWWAWDQDGRVAWSWWRWAALAAGPLIFVLYYLPFLGYLRRMRVLRLRVQRVVDESTAAMDDVQHAMGEVVRLGGHYRQLMRWAEVLGRVLYRPWSPVEEEGEESGEREWESVDAAAFQVALGGPDHERLGGLALRARRTVTRRGWLGGLWGQMMREADTVIRDRLGIPPEEASPLPEHDKGVDGGGPLAIVRDLLASGRLQDQIREQLEAEIRGFLDTEVKPEELLSQVKVRGFVVPGGDADSGSTVAMERFLNLVPEREPEPLCERELIAEALVEGCHRVRHTVCAVPPSIRSRGGRSRGDPGASVSPPVEVVDLPPITTASGDYLVRAVRLDRSDPLLPKMLALRIAGLAEQDRDALTPEGVFDQSSF